MSGNPIQIKKRAIRDKEILRLYWEEELTTTEISNLSKKKFGKKISQTRVSQIIKNNPKPEGF